MKKSDLQHKNKDELVALLLSSHQEFSREISEKEAQEKTLWQQVSKQEKELLSNKHTIASLQFQLDKLLRHRFGKRSEKDLDDARQGELFDEAIEPENIPEIEQAEADITITVPEHTRKKTGRKPLPRDLPRVQQVHDIADDDKVCACGCELTLIGKDTSEQLDIIPAKVQVIEHVKLKYACKACEQTILTAKAPRQPIPKSIASPGTLAYVITAKYCDHLPLYRQESIFARMGVDIARNTLSHWMIKSAELLISLYKLMQHQLISYDVAWADETRVQVLKEANRKPEAQSFMWLFVGGSPGNRCALYHYQPSRAHAVIEDFLEDFEGYLHCDGYSGYDSFAKDHKVLQVGCWAHARRKFYDVAKAVKSGGLAHKAVALIKKLYKVEKNIKALGLATPELIKAYRQKHAKGVLDKFRNFIDDNINRVLPKSPLGQAFFYAHNQWAKLIKYIEDGRLSIDNNLAERAIKPFVIGRKNFLFCDSVAGAQAAQVLYSLIETCKLNNLEPYGYLRHVLAKIPSAQTEEALEELLPFNVNTEKINR